MNIGGGSDPKDSGEKLVLEYVNNRLASLGKLIVFDVGTNAGKYSVLAKEVMGEGVKIYSFEPSHKTF